MTTEEISLHLDNVKGRLREAAVRSGRSPEEITLIAVTKTQTAETLERAYEAGIRTVGENRVQEIQAKWPLFENRFEWHLIGHLQTNKVKYIMDKVALIHSVDSLKLAAEISRLAVKAGKEMSILIQVNPAQEATKFGLSSGEVEALVLEAAALPGIRVQGLMTIAPFIEDEAILRQVFKEMKTIFEALKAKEIPGVEMKHLSMGMTHDFELAIEEGATMVRIGSGIFGERG